MVHQFGSTEDYDLLAKITKSKNWSWKNIKPKIYVVCLNILYFDAYYLIWLSFVKHEKIVPPADGHNTTGQYIPANHGTNGTLLVTLPGFSQTIDAMAISATKQLSAEFPFSPDMGGGDVLGLGWVQCSIANGVRSSSSTMYLRPILARKNLHVLINATVTKLFQTGSKNGKPLFRGVNYASSSNGESHSSL